ncbi:ectonucleotide pyrophosphatase/phosphodiesterase family member 5-like [Babylonia areolata]|uniref:ectonucleotide pyrophosphatase/phosphodiesterase family member 5-like n=1 Tax=Babylonia areolata TaxID=304850 RepID=UPI003FD4F9CA
MGKPLMVMIAATAAAVVLATSAAEEVDSGTSDGGHTYSGKVLLVSMDGFRWDYIKSVAGLTSFSRLSDTGCSVDFVHPAFATKTFPCHYTIATGLYEESHGILANRMYDPVRNASFRKRSTESFWWEGGEPIWVTAERQNKRSAVYFWPGSDAEIRLLNLWDYLDRDTVAMVPDSGTVTAILPVEGREAQVLSDARKIPHVTVYRKDEIPKWLCYKHNPRVMPIIILSDEGWILSSTPGWDRNHKVKPTQSHGEGAWGWGFCQLRFKHQRGRKEGAFLLWAMRCSSRCLLPLDSKSSKFMCLGS